GAPDPARPSTARTAPLLDALRRLALLHRRLPGLDRDDPLLEGAHDLGQELPRGRDADLALHVDEVVGVEVDVDLGLRHDRYVEVRQHAAEVRLRDGRADLPGRRPGDQRRLARERVLPLGTRRPVDRVLEDAGDRAVVLGRDEHQRVGLLEGALEPGHALRSLGLAVLVVVGHLVDGHVLVLPVVRAQLLEREREPVVVRPVPQAADEHGDLHGHGSSSGARLETGAPPGTTLGGAVVRPVNGAGAGAGAGVTRWPEGSAALAVAAALALLAALLEPQRRAAVGAALAVVQDVLDAGRLERHGDDVGPRGDHAPVVGAVHAAVDAAQRLHDRLGRHAVLQRDRDDAADRFAVGVGLVAAPARGDEHLGGQAVLHVHGHVEAALLAARAEQLDLVGESRQAPGALEQGLARQLVVLRRLHRHARGGPGRGRGRAGSRRRGTDGHG